MKKMIAKLILTISCLSLTHTGDAQTNVYHPMPDSSATWCEKWTYGSSACYTEEDYTLFMHGDTLLGGNLFHKIYSTGKAYPPGCPYPPVYHTNKYYGAIREDVAAKKVYSSSSVSGFRLEYDFSLTVGDTIPVATNLIITHIDSAQLAGNYRKRFWVGITTATNHADSNQYYILEGIGSSVGLMLQTVQGVESFSNLLSFSQNNQAVYPDSSHLCQVTIGVELKNKADLLRVFPNPATAFVEVTVEGSVKSIIVYNSIGKMVNVEIAPLAKNRSRVNLSLVENGIYFVEVITDDRALIQKVAVNR